MLTIEKFPRCQAYLNAMWIRPPYAGMNDYWCAVMVAENLSDAYLAEQGTINFENMSGTQLLAALEDILARRASGRKKKRARTKVVSDVEKITAAISDDEIIMAMTPKGAWKAATLAKWGIAWPPPKGWRRKLIENFERTTNGIA